MDSPIIPETTKTDTEQQFNAMIPEMVVVGPYVAHPSGWHFSTTPHYVTGKMFVAASPPGYTPATSMMHTVTGRAASHVVALLTGQQEKQRAVAGSVEWVVYSVANGDIAEKEAIEILHSTMRQIVRDALIEIMPPGFEEPENGAGQ